MIKPEHFLEACDERNKLGESSLTFMATHPRLFSAVDDVYAAGSREPSLPVSATLPNG